jgi:hypothetical protein
MKNTSLALKLLLSLVFTGSVIGCYTNAQIPADYKGKPFADSLNRKGPQVIPGIVELAFYDLGGEGIAYHDSDKINNGSGKLNYDQNCPVSGGLKPGNYICHFRENESVDLSYTKDLADFNHANLYEPPVLQLYLGWEAKGEWTNQHEINHDIYDLTLIKFPDTVLHIKFIEI